MHCVCIYLSVGLPPTCYANKDVEVPILWYYMKFNEHILDYVCLYDLKLMSFSKE